MPIMTSVKTNEMKITPDQIATIMADYTRQHNAMMARSAANREAFARGEVQPYQAQPTEILNISDRH